MAYRPSRKLAFFGWAVAIGLVVFVVITFGDDLLLRIPLG
jgi:hypothetical protein